MKCLKVDPRHPDAESIAEAGDLLRRGGLVAFPTETVYGLGADALDPRAVRRIFEAKGRPGDNPLILHVPRWEDAEGVARVDPRAAFLFRKFSPGPLTLVLPALPSVPREVTAGLDTVAVRIPNHAVALALLREAGCPVAAPSANSSGRPSPTTAEAVLEDLGDRVDLVLDGGPAAVGLESTVVDATGEHLVLLRPGGLSLEDLEALGGPVCLPDHEVVLRRSPGTRHRHYAPRIPVVLWDPGEGGRAGSEELDPVRRWGYVGMAPPPFPCDMERRFPDLAAYAAGLFAALRSLERGAAEAILAEWPEGVGVGRALRDRLLRASEPSYTSGR